MRGDGIRNPRGGRPRSRRAHAGGAIALLVLAALTPALADIPRMTVGLGYGPAGLFHEEYVDGAMRASGTGEFTAGSTWLDLTFLLPSHLTLGVRTHSLRTSLGDGTAAGRLDLVPVTMVLGYRRPALSGRLGGFVSLAGGVATARFHPAATIGNWLPWERDVIDVTRERPGVFEASAGAAYRLADALSLELALTSAFVDTEVAFKPAPVDSTGFTPARAYRVSGRHLAASLVLRWWVEFL